MEEIYVIERMISIGIWELFSDGFYTNEKEALDACLKLIHKMHHIDKNFVARVKKLKKI